MTKDACAALVKDRDPDRFRAVLAADPKIRGDLFALFAFNLEIARAPWLTREPMIAEMRLQWWRDVVAEPKPRAHDVAGPIHHTIRDCNLPLPVLDQMIAARLWEVWREPFPDTTALWTYLGDTTGGLFVLASRIGGGKAETDGVVCDYGRVVGLANFLRAAPDLMAQGLRPLPDPSAKGIKDLAIRALTTLDQITPQIRQLPLVQRGALISGWQTRGLLARASADPEKVLTDGLSLSPFRQSLGLLWQAFSGRI